MYTSESRAQVETVGLSLRTFLTYETPVSESNANIMYYAEVYLDNALNHGISEDLSPLFTSLSNSLASLYNPYTTTDDEVDNTLLHWYNFDPAEYTANRATMHLLAHQIIQIYAKMTENEKIAVITAILAV